MAGKRAPRRDERGFALLVVLWSVVFLAFLMTQILAASRGATNLAAALRAAGAARAAEDGGISHAIFFSLVTGPQHWNPDGTPHMVTIGDIPVTIRIEKLDGLVNPNTASPALLAGLLHAVGEPDSNAAAIAQNIVAWRAPAPSLQAQAALQDSYRQARLDDGPPGKPFTDITQLTAVLGMTPALLSALEPHLSLFQAGDPNPKTADPIVLEALQYAVSSGAAASGFEGAPAITITACAAGAAPTCRQATVSLASPGALTPYRIDQIGDAVLGTGMASSK
jgi:general secretion pathway protein K